MSIDEEKTTEIEKLLESHLQPGQGITARCNREGVIEVADLADVEAPSALRESSPGLYGKLASISERISSATGCGAMTVFALVALGVCIALQTGLIARLFVDLDLRDQIQDFAHPLTYLAICVVCLFLWSSYDDLRERSVYRRYRHTALAAIARERLDVYRVITTAEGDPALSSLFKFVKKDPDPTYHDPALVDPEMG